MERQALEQLRKGDLRAARGTLSILAKLRPDDEKLRRRLDQVTELIEKRRDAHDKMQSEPLRYAHAYIKAGRLEEGLRLLRAAIVKDPDNDRLRTLAVQVARRIKASGRLGPAAGTVKEPQAPISQRDKLEAILDRVRTRRKTESRFLAST